MSFGASWEPRWEKQRQGPCRCHARLPLLVGSLAALAVYFAFLAISLALLAVFLIMDDVLGLSSFAVKNVVSPVGA